MFSQSIFLLSINYHNLPLLYTVWLYRPASPANCVIYHALQGTKRGVQIMGIIFQTRSGVLYRWYLSKPGWTGFQRQGAWTRRCGGIAEWRQRSPMEAWAGRSGWVSMIQYTSTLKSMNSPQSGEFGSQEWFFKHAPGDMIYPEGFDTNDSSRHSPPDCNSGYILYHIFQINFS